MGEHTVVDPDALQFGIRRSVRYHMRREAFYSFLNRVTSAMAVIFGSAAMASLLTDIDNRYAVLAAAIVTVFSAFDLVIGTASMARLHSDLRRRFLSLEKRLAMLHEPDAQQIADLQQARLDIEADEPPVLRALDTICHNDLLRAEGWPGDCGHYVPLPWYQRWTAQFINWPVAN